MDPRSGRLGEAKALLQALKVPRESGLPEELPEGPRACRTCHKPQTSPNRPPPQAQGGFDDLQGSEAGSCICLEP